MSTIHKYVGLDVHKDTISIAVAEEGRTEPRFLKAIPSCTTKLLRILKQLGPLDKILCAYEAGPTGYWLQRFLTSKGIRCQVIAPSEVPTKPGRHVKTDRIDALAIAKFLRSGDLTQIVVPTEEIEAMRDLSRTRSDAKLVEKDAKKRLGAFLLRHKLLNPFKTNWTDMHLDWVRKQKFDHEAQNIVLREYLSSVEQASARVKRLAESMATLAEECSLWPYIKALRACRGIDMITAAGIMFELVDLKRFPSAPHLMSYLGLVPSEDSSGKRRRQGSITKAGNSQVRRLLVEAAHNNGHSPKVTQRLRKRQEGVSQEVVDIAWRAQERLYRKRLVLFNRGKPKTCIVIAMARELVGFVWDIGQQERLVTN